MSNLSEAISEMRNMRESYDQIGAAAEAYNVGKTQLAQAITSKGVETSPTESYPEMAEKVAQIPLVTTTIDGGEMYAAQQFGDGVLWNLYDVLAQMKTRFMGTGDYVALIVCEYYKGYDSLVLQGADGYYTCDGDYYDYASPTHVWHDADNGKMNRWVVFLYHDEGARLDITNTNISPRSMYIGGHIGTIEYFVNGRLTDLVCGIEETDVVDYFSTAGYSQDWVRNVIIRGVNSINDIVLPSTTNGFVVFDLNTENITPADSVYNFIEATQANAITIKGVRSFTKTGNARCLCNIGSAQEVNILGLETFYFDGTGCGIVIINSSSSLRRLNIPDLKSGINNLVDFANAYTSSLANLIDFICGRLENSLYFYKWNPTNVLADATKKAQLIENIKNHILARVSDATGGTQLVFTVSTNMYNNIASENITWNDQTMTLADAFLTKNWLLAGA